MGSGGSKESEWRSASGGAIPHDAVAGGHDVNGETLYVGRCSMSGEIIPGKIVPSHGSIYVPYGGKEVRHSSYEHLIVPKYGRIEWHWASNGAVPSGAVMAGRTSNGEPLFISRVSHGSTLCVGKVHPSHHCAYIPFGGEEISYHQYEVLTVQY